MIKFLDLHQQYLEIQSEIDTAIANVISDSAFIGGPYAAKFEQQFADFLGAKHCIGTGNGTDALEIALEALELPPASEIIVPGNSFIATSEAVTRSGHNVVFCDVNPDTMNIDVSDAEQRITSKTVAIIAVHLYGHPADMNVLLSLKEKFGLAIIEDCAQAHAATLNDKMIGTLGDIAAFSFYPGKNLGAYGDAGAVVTNQKNLATKARMIANHGRIDKYDHEFEGRNSRLDGIQGAVLCVKLRYLDKWTDKRITVAKWYTERLNSIESLILPTVLSGAKHVYHLYVIRTQHRDHLRECLQKSGIQTGIHYPVALPKLKAYSDKHTINPDMIINNIGETLLSLPMGPHLTETDVDTVSQAITQFFT